MTSFRRWMIRGFFLALLLLWVVGWAVSTCCYAWSGYFRGGKGPVGLVGPGVVVFAWYRGAPVADGWHGKLDPCSFHLVAPDFWWERVSSANADATRSSFSLVGFSYTHISRFRAPAPPYMADMVGVPFWFLLVVSGVAVWWAWRKTAPSLRGFPVEAAPSIRG